MQEAFFASNPLTYDKQIKLAKDDLSRNIGVWIYASAFFGFALAPLSQGILPLAVFYVLFEVIFAFNIKCKYSINVVALRCILIIVGLTAFFIGRTIINRDKNMYQLNYDHYLSYGDIWSTFTGLGPPPGQK